MRSVETLCPLCEIEEESGIYLFSRCLLARALWFGICWGAHVDELSLNSIKDSQVLLQQVSKRDFTLMATLIMKTVWRVETKKVFQQIEPNLEELRNSIPKRFRE